MHFLDTEQLDHIARNVHASGCIHSGRNPERHFAGIQWLAAELSDFQQRFQAWVHRTAQRTQTQAGNDPVLANEWDRVGDGRDGGNFRERKQ